MTDMTVLARRWTRGTCTYASATVVARITGDALLVRFEDGTEQAAFEEFCGIPTEYAARIAALPVDVPTLNRPWK